MRMRRRRSYGATVAAAVALSVIMTACDSGSTVRPEEMPLLPGQVLFRADAAGVADNGKDTQCWVETYIEIGELVQRNGRNVQLATGGGDAFRSIDHGDGTAVQFWAHTGFADLEFHHVSADSLEIRSPLGEAVTDSRFWHELGFMAGQRRAETLAPGELARGTWTCHPMDTSPEAGSYYDFDGSLEGTWVLRVR